MCVFILYIIFYFICVCLDIFMHIVVILPGHKLPLMRQVFFYRFNDYSVWSVQLFVVEKWDILPPFSHTLSCSFTWKIVLFMVINVNISHGQGLMGRRNMEGGREHN